MQPVGLLTLRRAVSLGDNSASAVGTAAQVCQHWPAHCGRASARGRIVGNGASHFRPSPEYLRAPWGPSNGGEHAGSSERSMWTRHATAPQRILSRKRPESWK